MYSDKKNVLQLVALLRAHGIRRAVLCPGSRNVPLVQAFATCEDFGMLFGDGRAQCRFLRRRIGFACTGSRGGLLHLRFGFAQPPSGGVRGVLPSGTFW